MRRLIAVAALLLSMAVLSSCADMDVDAGPLGSFFNRDDDDSDERSDSKKSDKDEEPDDYWDWADN